MNELIIQELRLDFEELIRQKGQTLKDTCYQQHKKTLDGVLDYSKCIQASKQELKAFERRGKCRLIFMELSGEKQPEEFKLIESVAKFIEDYNLNKNSLTAL